MSRTTYATGRRTLRQQCEGPGGDAQRINDRAAVVNLHEDSAHTPGPTQAAVERLIHPHDVRGFGVETVNTDAGQSYASRMPGLSPTRAIR